MRKKVINTKYYEKFSDFKEAIKNFFDNIAEYADELSKFIGTKFHLFANWKIRKPILVEYKQLFLSPVL